MAAQSPDANDSAPAEEPDLEIETIGSWTPELQEEPDPHRQRHRYALRPCGKPGTTPKIYVHAVALEEILEHAGSDLRREVGGVLVGRFFLCGGHPVTEVRTVIRAPQTRAGMAHVTFSHETWAAINATMDKEPEEHKIVGWYHSHPNYGIFVSPQDVFTHDYFFDYEGHVALVVDPCRHQIGAFTKREGRVLPAPGFWIAAPSDRPELPKRYARMLNYAVGNKRRGPWGFLRQLLG